MPGFAQLKDEELAALLNHLMALLKAEGEPFKPEEIIKERGQNLARTRSKGPRWAFRPRATLCQKGRSSGWSSLRALRVSQLPWVFCLCGRAQA